MFKNSRGFLKATHNPTSFSSFTFLQIPPLPYSSINVYKLVGHFFGLILTWMSKVACNPQYPVLATYLIRAYY
jgi:hypothetical protein